MAEPFTLLALALDAAIGWPNKLYARIGHPVGLFARLIESAERHWNKPSYTAPIRRFSGIVLVGLLLILIGGVSWGIELALHNLAGTWSWLALGLLAWPGLAQRSLYEHVKAVHAPLQAGDLTTARQAVSMIVGRDTKQLDSHSTARAAIESLGESFCDGVVAPCFWLVLGGLPGLWVYKAINTADSLIGHKETRWRSFGWAAARLDDVLNWLPARIGGVLICLTTTLTKTSSGWRIMWRDCKRHASPNAGWTEAAMAGVLGLKLAGPIMYDGVAHEKEWIGEGRETATAEDIRRALQVFKQACFLLWLITSGAILWAL